MKKLHILITKRFFFLFFFFVSVFIFVVYLWFKSLYIKESKKSILNSINIIELSILENKKLNIFVKDIKYKTGYRVTIIDNSGKLIADSDIDKKILVNYKNRKEILEAVNSEIGSDIRFSKTLKKDILYVAKKVIVDRDIIFIRMAKSLESMNSYFINLAIKLVVVFFIFSVVSISIFRKIFKDIDREISSILSFLKILIKQKKVNSIESNYSLEFYKLAKYLNKVSKTLFKLQKEKDKYYSKFKLANKENNEIILAVSNNFQETTTAISGYVQALKSEDKNLGKKIKDKFLDNIFKNTVKSTKFIDRLRVLVQLDNNQKNLILTKVNIYEILKVVVSELKQSYPNRKIIINKNIDLILEADETLFSIVLYNLIENALKYSDDEVIININETDIEIIDKGIGVSDKEISKITKKFYRAYKDSWHNSLGIGLFVVDKILKLHNFKLDIKSQLNIGSNFRIVCN